MARSLRHIYRLSRKYKTDSNIVVELVELVGNENTEAILKMKPGDIKNTARVNEKKNSRTKVIQHLREEGIIAHPIKQIKEGISISKGWAKLGSSISYLSGEVMPQGFASMATVEILDPKPGERILDMAAAPGGKSCFIGERMRDRGTLYANDISTKRLRSLLFNLARHEIEKVVVTNKNALDIEIDNLDKILLDAPCTGAGLLVSKPEIRRSKTHHDHIQLQKLQQNLLQHAINLLPSGGICVYATCSFSILENEEVVKTVLPRVNVLDTSLDAEQGVIEVNDEFKKARRYYPNHHGCDGFFIIKLEKI